MPDKTIDRDLEVGQWKLGLDDGKGHYELESVHLIGLRNRPFPLMRVDADEFKNRVPFDAKGSPVESPFAMRGVPVAYYAYGTRVFLWPAPAHKWTIRLSLRVKPERRHMVMT